VRVLLVATLAALAAAGCSAQSAAPPAAPLQLEALAAAWSGGTATPNCAAAPGDADLPAPFRTMQCAWPRVVRGREFGHVTGMQQGPEGALHALTWERAVTDSLAAAWLADSLGTALRAARLAEHRCPDAGRRWQAPGLTVQYTRGVVHADGLLRVAVFATTLPNAIPDLMCPNAPKLPPLGAPAPGRGTAT
jgi:hypothetical protein